MRRWTTASVAAALVLSGCGGSSKAPAGQSDAQKAEVAVLNHASLPGQDEMENDGCQEAPGATPRGTGYLCAYTRKSGHFMGEQGQELVILDPDGRVGKALVCYGTTATLCDEERPVSDAP